MSKLNLTLEDVTTLLETVSNVVEQRPITTKTLIEIIKMSGNLANYGYSAKDYLKGLVDNNPGTDASMNKYDILRYAKMVDDLRNILSEIRFFVAFNKLLENINLTVSEAKLFDVCRICKQKSGGSPDNPFVLNYGDEYAHQKCL